ncbi:MAG: rod shape-determining protein RodA [Chloroflexi bacterium]|nr:rod shape-determining protein RodA [Chloroflexota bacterium]
MERSAHPRFAHFDFWLVGATLLLTLIGVAMIYSATACITGEALDWASPALRQVIYAIPGLIGMAFFTAIDYRVWGALRWLIWGGMVGSLALVFVIGQLLHGATRWIDLGFFLFQPSEISKLLAILVVAKYMADHEEQMARWRNLGVSFALVALPMALIYIQPDLGTTIVLGATWGMMALSAGMRWRDVLIIIAIFTVAAVPIFQNLRAYQQDRILTFLDPARDPLGSGYNVTQARIAIGAGGLWGVGYCSGTQSQLRFLRIRHTDFIFSVIGEELGFIGALFVLALIIFILWRLIRAAQLARTPYGKLLALGIAAVIFIQSWINLAMNLGLLPVVGVPLPFVSSGGSSLITLLSSLGIAQSVLLRHSGLQLEGSGGKYV